LQLLGQRPLGRDAIEWQGWTEPILPAGDAEAIAELRRRMLLQLDDGLPDDPAGRRAALLRRVDEETERLRERRAGHRRREAADRAELADRLAVDTSAEGELMRRYQLDNDRKLERALNGLVKLRRAAGAGMAGDPAPEDRSEPEAEPVGAVEPEGGPADGPEGEGRLKEEGGGLKGEGGRLEDEGGPADRLPSSLIPHPSWRNPGRPSSVMGAPRGARKTSPAHRLMATNRRETNSTPRPKPIRSRQTNSAHRSAAIRSRPTNSRGRGGSPTRASRPWSAPW
jgi:hypothetical protein